jgi:hypothetical protein
MYANIYTFKQVGLEFVEKDKQKIPSQCNTQGTLSVKFGIYVRHTTIFRGVLDNFTTYFYHPIII